MNPRAEIARERRRQMQVRQVFEAVLADEQAGDAGQRAEFFIACAEYILFSMDRLHDQDQAIHDFLKQRVPVEDADAHRRLDELGERQRKSRKLVDGLRENLARLRESGRDGLQAFESAARKFVSAFKNLLAPRKNPFASHTDRLFTDDDWVLIAGVTEDSLAREEALFVAVQRKAPAGIDPAVITVEHR